MSCNRIIHEKFILNKEIINELNEMYDVDTLRYSYLNHIIPYRKKHVDNLIHGNSDDFHFEELEYILSKIKEPDFLDHEKSIRFKNIQLKYFSGLIGEIKEQDLEKSHNLEKLYYFESEYIPLHVFSHIKDYVKFKYYDILDGFLTLLICCRIPHSIIIDNFRIVKIDEIMRKKHMP